MRNQDLIKDIKRLPVRDEERVRTDVFCVLCNTIFVILLLIISFAVYNNYHLMKMSLPNDSQGNICGFEAAHNFTILYYPDIKDPLKRVCVAKCPTKADTSVQCFANNKTTCQSLVPPPTDTYFDGTRIALFCFPNDKTQRDLLKDNIGIDKRFHFMGLYDALWRSFWISALFAIAFVVLLQFFPRRVVPWTILIGAVIQIICGLLVMILSTGSILWRVLFFLISLGLAAGCLFTLFKQQRMKQIFVYSRLIEVSSIVLKQNILTVLYVPLFIGLLFILLVLAGFQILAAWSFSTFVFQQNYPFYQLKGFGSHLLHILIFVQFVWGLCFLKQAANFCVSGVSTQWYFKRNQHISQIKFFKPLINLFRFHWGSALGCALLTATLFIFDYILDFFMNNDTNVDPANYKAYESLEQEKVYREKRGCNQFLNLCRSQTMSYINLVSIPYCNAARYCEQLSTSSHFFDYGHSTSRTYRISAHTLIASLVTFISVLTSRSYSGQSGILGIFLIGLMSLFTITFFIGLHGDLAQGLTISTFIDQGYTQSQGRKKHITAPPRIMKSVYYCDINDVYHKDTTLKDLLLGNDKLSKAERDIDNNMN